MFLRLQLQTVGGSDEQQGKDCNLTDHSTFFHESEVQIWKLHIRDRRLYNVGLR